MKQPEDYERLLPDFRNPNATIYIRSLPDRKIVWVNHEFVRDHGYSYDDVIGKTIPELFGAAADEWELSDRFALASRTPITMVEDYNDPEHGFRQYGLTKFIAKDQEGDEYLVGIGVEIKNQNKSVFERRLRDLTLETLRLLQNITL